MATTAILGVIERNRAQRPDLKLPAIDAPSIDRSFKWSGQLRGEELLQAITAARRSRSPLDQIVYNALLHDAMDEIRSLRRCLMRQ